MVSRREAGIVARLLGTPPEGAILLDVPCGAGRHAARLGEAGWQVIAADSSPEMIRYGLVKQDLEEGACLVASIDRLPLADQGVEACTCIRFLHHLHGEEERLAVLSELRRIARGPVVVSIWTGFNLQSLRRSVKRALGRRPSARREINLARFNSELARTGFAVKRIQYLFRYISETVYLLIRPGAPDKVNVSEPGKAAENGNR
ncbi:MAG: class I SAM-dependent methyltransferase [Planctomycetota bacterium]|jgi:ubiquinone/menaquinone biosynthesis C-methylase UbiE